MKESRIEERERLWKGFFLVYFFGGANVHPYLLVPLFAPVFINSQLHYSHLVTIPPGPHILSDMLIPTPIIAGEDGALPGFAAGGSGNFEYGVDPGLDPELALVSLVCS